MIKTAKIEMETKGNCHIADITDLVKDKLVDSGLLNGVITLFNVGSTAAISTIEYEPGLVNTDIKAALEKIAPENGYYDHENTWHDDNGHSHVRATLIGPSLNVPFIDGELTLGTWQQICLFDFDTRSRRRTIICQMIGE